jgi:hypothetical protein
MHFLDTKRKGCSQIPSTFFPLIELLFGEGEICFPIATDFENRSTFYKGEVVTNAKPIATPGKHKLQSTYFSTG